MAGKSINELPEITSVSDSSLMALSSDGKTLGRVDARTFKNSVVGQHISNYIRYINQDIKLELHNGTLTLKAGSIAYVPNGFESDGTTPKFDVVTVASDKTTNGNSASKYFLYVNSNNAIGTMRPDFCYSGSSAPTVTHTYALWFDTTTNSIKQTSDNGSTWTTGHSFPFAIVINNTPGTVAASSIDQVFNGFGYIGSTIFALPGTVVSMPNGKEENGVLKNTEVEITSVRTVTLGSADTTGYIGYLSPTGIDYMLATNYYESAVPPTNKNGYAMWLNTQDNHFYVKNFSVSGSEWELVDALGNICKFTTSSGKITKFESKSVLSLLDTNTFNLVPHIVETWSNGTAWYRLYSDGWCEQGGRFQSADGTDTVVNFLKPFSDANYTPIVGQQYGSNGRAEYRTFNIYTISQASMTVHNATNGTNTCIWMACGYIN